MASHITRRSLLTGAAGVVVIGLGAAAVEGPRTLAKHMRDDVLGKPEAVIPTAPEGQIHLDTVYSHARGQDVSLFTAVPAGYGSGAGLPVCLILHGASARPPDYQRFGFGRFLTAAVRNGAPPFVLAGADGGLLFWEPGHEAGDNPQAMVIDEMPGWLDRRGFDTSRMAAWGWSMGGYGVLRLAEVKPNWLKAVAAFSPAVEPDDRAFGGVAALAGQPTGVWCGTSDPLYQNVRQFVAAMPQKPDPLFYGEGAHTRAFWDSVTPQAFAFVGEKLTPAG
jgi:pimeloyl-ACP methyl ester carboxylesterase